MAYHTRWTVKFRDLDENLRTIYIQQDGWTGGQTELIAGANPLVWDEDSGEDLTKGVRGITGRLQVVEENYGDLADLYPTTPLQLRVQCQNVFVGFIKVQNNTNQWVCGPRAITLNIVSPLALAYDIPMPITHELGMREMGTVMAEMMNTIGYSYVSMPKGNVDDLGEFFAGSVRGWLLCPYADDKDYHYGTDDEIFDPVSVGEFIEMICERHNLIAHDAFDAYSPSLVFSRIGDTNGSYRWSYTNIANGNYSTAELLEAANADPHALLTDFSVASNDNSESSIHPYSYIDISHAGDSGEDNIIMPTKQSQYLPSSPYTLTPRGIWLTNLHSAFALGNIDSATSDEATPHDTVFFDNRDGGSALADNTLLFSCTFYNINRVKLYRLKFKYLHVTDAQGDAIRISARGKNENGWYAPNGGQTPTGVSEVKQFMTLNGDTHSIVTLPYTLFEAETGFVMQPGDYITVNFYSGSNDLKNLYIVDVELATETEITSTTRWEQKPFVERILGSRGDKPLSINMRLNNTFFSNFYQTDYAFLEEYPTFLLYGQKRIQVTVRGNQLNKLWYLRRYYINDNMEDWRIIAITYNVRDNTYKLTLHQIRILN